VGGRASVPCPEVALKGDTLDGDSAHQHLLTEDCGSMMEPAWWSSLAHERLSRWLEVQWSGSNWWRRSAPRSSACMEERAEARMERKEEEETFASR
jgi:hypothetical protein